MIFFPYSTDAPIYHLPFTTVALVVANIAIFFATTFQLMLGNGDVEAIEPLILQFNQINPLQWISGAFMHADPLHLLGNMFFLWTFGLVIEGKVGWFVFAALYFLIALVDGAVVQIPMYLLRGESGALGASGAIFALMVIALIWAPENEMDCFYLFLFRPGTFEVRIVTLGVVFIFLQIAFLYLGGFSMSSEMLHIVGAMIGAPIGFLMLRQGWVDCEGWDLVSRSDVLREMSLFRSDQQRAEDWLNVDSKENPIDVAMGRRPQRKQETQQQRLPRATERKRKRAQQKVDRSMETATAREHPEFNRLAFVLRQAVESKNVASADQAFHQLDKLNLVAGIGEKILFLYATLLGQKGKRLQAIAPLRLIARRNGPLANHARLRIAFVQLRELNDPPSAIETLQQVDESAGLANEAKQKRDALLAEARRKGASG